MRRQVVQFYVSVRPEVALLLEMVGLPTWESVDGRR